MCKAGLILERREIMTTNHLNTWERRVKQLKMETYTIYLAYKDPRVAWYVKILILFAIGYAFSPIDKFLKSIPIIGYLDHFILVPLGMGLTFIKMIPSAIWTDCREIAMSRQKPKNWCDDFIILCIWLLFVSLATVSVTWAMKDWNLVLGQWFRWFARMISTSKGKG
jgi:uncharacterized membrane protein YkvA (DUF1232 family)